ncbi:GspH/FimT family pseudopilin [Nitrincola sp. MINF-07-Sa-05]|uniref:GspH/FimT family pseudopilin n=1 Tax=Nitrincola salilacus TaxID=3400273 RepID=UPI003917F33A
MVILDQSLPENRAAPRFRQRTRPTAPIVGESGFTLFEILIVIALVAILSTLAVPGFQNLIAEQQVRAVATDLHTTMLLARSEAIKRNQAVVLRPASGETWSDGWLIRDPATPTVDTNPLARERTSDNVTITTTVTELSFRPSGRLSLAGNVNFDVESTLKNDKKRCLTIGLDGRASITKGACS